MAKLASLSIPGSVLGVALVLGGCGNSRPHSRIDVQGIPAVFQQRELAAAIRVLVSRTGPGVQLIDVDMNDQGANFYYRDHCSSVPDSVGVTTQCMIGALGWSPTRVVWDRERQDGADVPLPPPLHLSNFFGVQVSGLSSPLTEFRAGVPVRTIAAIRAKAGDQRFVPVTFNFQGAMWTISGTVAGRGASYFASASGQLRPATPSSNRCSHSFCTSFGSGQTGAPARTTANPLSP